MHTHTWLARRAAMTPNHNALVAEGQPMSYRTLARRVEGLARGLAARGVGPGDRVGVLAHNDPCALETLFACGLIGATYVILHPGYEPASLRRVLELVEPRLVVAMPDLVPRLEQAGGWPEVVVVGTAYEMLVRASGPEPQAVAGAGTPWLVGFSSGTTGRTKGVELTHGNLVANAVNTVTTLGFRDDDVLLGSAPLYRLGGLGFALSMLFVGGTVVLQRRADPARSLALIAEHGVTVVFDGVAALEAMAEEPAAGEVLSSLRGASTGGSAVPWRVVDRYRELGVCLQPGYGLTEAAPLALVVPRHEVYTHPGASGRPPVLTEVRVVDGDGDDAEPGRLGELWVRGPNVMTGYWRDPERTRRALVGGWLRTGDCVEIASDGMITVRGRMCDAFVWRDRLMHPGRLEAALRDLGVVDAAVVPGEWDGAPRVFVAGAGGVAFEALQSACVDALGPGFDLRAVAALPRNANGKVLRGQLAAEPAPARRCA